MDWMALFQSCDLLHSLGFDVMDTQPAGFETEILVDHLHVMLPVRKRLHAMIDSLHGGFPPAADQTRDLGLHADDPLDIDHPRDLAIPADVHPDTDQSRDLAFPSRVQTFSLNSDDSSEQLDALQTDCLIIPDQKYYER